MRTFSAKKLHLLVKKKSESGPMSGNPDPVDYTGGYPVFNNLEPGKGKG